MRYDACIIGAGAEGLTCAARLAACGLKVIVLERGPAPGGRCMTQEFAPGHRASPFTDELPAIPPDLYRALDLARRGALFAPAESGGPAAAIRDKVLAQVTAEADAPRLRWFRRPPRRDFPGEELATRTLAELGNAPALVPSALCDPDLPGSALGLLAMADGGLPRGGLGCLGLALKLAAEEAGATISCGSEVSDIRRRGGRAVAVGLADRSEIAARAIISTLDFKRTFLSLFAWNDLPKPLVERAGAFRAAPGVARLLVALETLPTPRRPGNLRRPIRQWSTADAAYRAWRSNTVPERPPADLRVVSAVDPFLAPDGAATLTVTLGAIPYSPFDGPWSPEKRESLRARALAIVEEAFPGAAVKASELILPPDIEARLGLTEGDLSGGDYSPMQMLAFRPFPESRGTRTPIEGLYLAGPSSALGPLATCASGAAAARAVLADIRAGRFR